MKNILLILFLIPTIGFTQVKINTSKMYDFKSYGVNGGYEPGSFCVIKKKVLTSPIIKRKDLLPAIIDKSLLDLSTKEPIPNQVFNRTKEFVSEIKAKAIIENVSIGLDYDIENIQTVTLTVNKGSRYGLDRGKIVIRKILKKTSLSDLEDIYATLKEYNKVHLISEVIEYENAKMEITWNKKQNPSIGASLVTLFSINASAKWTDKGSLIINYNEPVRIGYKSWLLNRKYLKEIKKIIEEKQTENKTGSLMDRCIEGSLNACDEIASDYTSYGNSIKSKIELEKNNWEEAKVECGKMEDKVAASHCQNKAAGILGGIYQKIALLSHEIQSFKSLKDQMYLTHQNVKSYGVDSNEYKTAKADLFIKIGEFQKKVVYLNPNRNKEYFTEFKF